MRSIGILVIVVGFPCLTTRLAAQLPARGHVVALDDGAARLLRSYYPTLSYDSLIQSESESYQAINHRAWTMRHATCLVYRSDQLSMTGRIFRDRLMAQGVRIVDLASNSGEQAPALREYWTAEVHVPRVHEQGSIAMSSPAMRLKPRITLSHAAY